MTAVNLRLSNRLASALCAHASMLLSDARNVASSDRQSQTFRRKLSSRVRNVIKSVLSFCSGQGSRQEIFLSIKFTSLCPRNGSRLVMASLTAPENCSISAVISVLTRTKIFRWRQSLTQRAQRKPATGLTLPKGKIQCQTNLYLYIECTSLRMSLPAFWATHAAYVQLTYIACQIPVKIASRVRPSGVSVLILRRRLLPCG